MQTCFTKPYFSVLKKAHTPQRTSKNYHNECVITLTRTVMKKLLLVTHPYISLAEILSKKYSIIWVISLFIKIRNTT